MNDLHIITARSSLRDISSFCYAKIALKNKDYPLKETRKLLNQYLPKLDKSTLDDRTLLIKVPSGSGTNKITHLLANALSESTGASVLPDGLIAKLHKAEAKKNLSLEKRVADPIRYRLNSRAIKDVANQFKKIVIVDDVIGTGESSIRLQRALEAHKIHIDKLMGLVTIDNRAPKLSDMLRLFNKIDSILNLPHADKNNLREDIYTVFEDYTRVKLNRIERTLYNEQSVKAAFKIISEAAKQELHYRRALKKGLSL